VQRTTLRIRLEVPIEDLLQRAVHSRPPRYSAKGTSRGGDCADAGRRPASALFADWARGKR
jgi:hypothetical protein